VGVELVRLLASEGDRVFTTARARELGPLVGLKNEYLWEALHHLRRNGWIVPLRRGLYALSSTVPGVTPAHEFEIAMALFDPAAVSHWSALHHHGLTEQVPRKVFVLTTTAVTPPRARGPRASEVRDGYPVGGTPYRFIQVKPERFFGTEKVWIGDARVTITDPERTLLDGLSRPQHCGDFAEVLQAFGVRAPALNVERIVGYALKLDTATAKRLGWVLEHQGLAASQLERLATMPIRGYRKLDPTGPRQGPRNRRWMIQENLPGRVKP
jgi:predicted transcriptional regulator of viral defense system